MNASTSEPRGFTHGVEPWQSCAGGVEHTRVEIGLNSAETLAELNVPGYRLHALKGDLKGFWSITVSGNWRITFRFENGDWVKPDAFLKYS